jgi:hypothetical protein
MAKRARARTAKAKRKAQPRNQTKRYLRAAAVERSRNTERDTDTE